jgi:hypothetical protein
MTTIVRSPERNARPAVDNKRGIHHNEGVRSSLRAVLAVLFLVAQSALAFHHHDADLALRASGRFRSTATISANDDCALCAFQIQPRTATPEPVAVVAAPISVVVLSDVPSQAPRIARFDGTSARAPPVV